MKSKARSKKWWEELDQDEVREALSEATTDANDEEEQLTGLLTAIQGELSFPFRGRVLGEEVQVVDVEWPEDDAYGLDLVCERNGQRHRVAARNVELLEPLPEGQLFLAAYLDWKRRL